MCEDTCDSAALVISELVTNAIVHTASGTVVCELHDSDELVRIAVRDEGCAPGEPHPSPPRPEEEHGRGLILIDALCHAWGAQEHGPGLLVWAELPRTAVGPPDAAEPQNDLGWGARPKPEPSGGSGEDHDRAQQRLYVVPETGGLIPQSPRIGRQAQCAPEPPLAPHAVPHAPEPHTAPHAPERPSAPHAPSADGDPTSWRPHPTGPGTPGIPSQGRGRQRGWA